jgi:cytochrome c oxidase subunit 2
MKWVGLHSALDPAGPQAERIGDLWWLMLWVTTAVFVLVMAALLIAIFRRGHGPEEPGQIPPESRRRITRVVAGAVGVTVIVLFALLFASVGTGRALGSLSAPQALTIKLTGYQWWWRVEYQDPVPSRMVTTANEIHIPTGRPVLIQLASADVIHSFWVPNLHGKRDLIPGHEGEIWIEAERPGVYRGQCAEFCGHQHAKMGLLVVAEPPERFAAWLDAQRRPAVQPVTPAQQRGRQLIETLPCALCHTVQGTEASGKTGPDLTHLATRRTLAAGTLPNTPGNLAGWIVDPQGIKPGNHMSSNLPESEDLQALLSYLGSLK